MDRAKQKQVALEVGREIDLSLFSRYLRQIGVTHRVSEQGDRQVVVVDSDVAAAQVQSLYTQLQQGEVELTADAAPVAPSGYLRAMWQTARGSPATISLVLLNVVLFPVTWGLDQGRVTDLLPWMTFVAMSAAGGFSTVSQTVQSGEFWRLLTPMFLHFGAMHIVFNLIWVWTIGRQIEKVNGAMMLLLVVVVSSLSANLTQYFLYGASLFGGMSGVVFGLLGFSLVWSMLVPERYHGLPPGVYIFMLVFLGLGFTGIFDFLTSGTLANGAHLGGLVAGLALGRLASGFAPKSEQ